MPSIAPWSTTVSLTVPTGKLYGLVGPGAAGKVCCSRSFRASSHRRRAKCSSTTSTSGHSIKPSCSSSEKGVGMLFQNNALFDFMTVEENVAFPLKQLLGLSAESAAPKVRARLKDVGLPGFEARYPAGLSGGQKKRVGMARATITQAPVVLYDEPAAGLDPVSSQRLFELLRAEQQANGTTVLMVSSDIDRLLPITDYVGMMLKGRLIFEGTTHEAIHTTDPTVRQFLRGEIEGPL